MKILLANPRGFCAGVDRAIEVVECALKRYGAPIYVRHEVVHNHFVVDKLRTKGAIFVDELCQVPTSSTVIFSAHGVSCAVRNAAKKRNLKIFDATCPLVTKVHVEVKRYRQQGYEVILIGHGGHPEVEGTMGQVDDGIYLVETTADAAQLKVNNPEKLAFVSQTTLSMDDTAKIIATLKQRFTKIHSPRKDDICYATQNRQDAVKALSKQCDLVFVVGSPNSSNSNRLREIAEQSGLPAYLIDGPDDINPQCLHNKHVIGVTAGASAPESLVEAVITWLCAQSRTVAQIELAGPKEYITFSLPAGLRAL